MQRGDFVMGSGSLCDNSRKTEFHMRLFRMALLGAGGSVLASVFAWPQLAPPAAPAPAPPLVLAGGTVVDVTDWGRSAKDQQDAVVIVRGGRIVEVGPRADVAIPKDAQVIDCSGKYIIPGLVDGFAGMSSQGQANANLYMGVTTVVATDEGHRKPIDLNANPSPHLYVLDSIGSTDNESLLIHQPEWAAKLKEGSHPTELSPQDTSRQLADTAKLGTRVLWLGRDLTAVNTQWIVARAHQAGMVTYGEFVSTPYRVGVEAGVDALLHMGRYELGTIPGELQSPLVDQPYGTAANTAYDYAERLPPTDPHLREYARFLAKHHAALMPTLSLYYLLLPDHRNLWKEPAASLLDPDNLVEPSDRDTGELVFGSSSWIRFFPSALQRWLEESNIKKNQQSAMRLWQINETIFAAYPHYLAASSAPVMGTMPGISMHTELEMLVRLGLSPREALAAATNNYSLQFGWTELGQIAPGRRADILVVDGDPTASVWNVRRISNLILDGSVIDRQALLKLKK